MSAAAQPKKWAGAGRFDPVRSTYKHIIYMNTNEGVKPLVGYSKSLTEVEAFDKIVLLEKQLLRFIKIGYLFGRHQKYNTTTNRIEYYLNGTYQGVPDEAIFTLYPDEYVFSNNQDFIENVRLNTFLTRLYEQSRTGEFITKSLYHKPENRTADDLFNEAKKRFDKEPQLHAWIQERIREGHPRGIVFDYYVKYCAKWFDK